MLVLDHNNDALVLDSIFTPTIADHIWVLDLNMMDFTLTPLLVLEEIVAPTLEILVCGFKFVLPANWNILVADADTMQLDVIEVKKLPGKQFDAFLYGPNTDRHELATITVTDYFLSHRNIGPSLNRHHMLCHPVSPEFWVNISPSDTYNKYLKNRVAGDLT